MRWSRIHVSPARGCRPEVIELAVALKRENPARTATQVRWILRAQLGWAPGERTLQRHFATDPLIAVMLGRSPPAGPAARGCSAGLRPTAPSRGRSGRTATGIDYARLVGAAH